MDIPSSKLKVRIAEILKDEGFIKNFRVIEDPKQGTLRVYLKYGAGNEKMISGLVRVSHAGTAGVRDQGQDPDRSWAAWAWRFSPPPRGVMTDREARKQQVGGEVLAYVW